MRLNIVPASQGIQWMKQGIATFRKKPLAMLGLFFIFLTVVNLLSLIPWLGIAMALAMLPAATLGFMTAAREVAQGNYPMPTVLLTAFRAGQQRLHAIAVLGMLYAVLFGLSMAVTQWVDGGQFVRIYLLGEAIEPATMRELMSQGDFQMAAILAGTLNVVIAMLFWHAPALVHWHGVSPVKSLFFSIVACLRNFPAFFVYLMAWVGLTMLVVLGASLLFTAIAGPVIGSVLMQLLLMVITAMFFTSQYFSYLDCFVEARDSSTEV